MYSHAVLMPQFATVSCDLAFEHPVDKGNEPLGAEVHREIPEPYDFLPDVLAVDFPELALFAIRPFPFAVSSVNFCRVFMSNPIFASTEASILI